MAFETGIVTALQRYGLDVDTVSGWQTRGSSSFNPAGVVGHHTAGPKTGDRPSLAICVEGRSDLPGPLCNVFLPRGLTAAQQAPVVVAAGRANHAGPGGFRGLVGNSAVFGIEAEDDGVDGIWTDWQLWAYPRVVAGLLWLAGRDESWYCSHRTWAPDRKIDPTGINDSWMRARVHDVFHPTTAPAPSTPTPLRRDPDMFIAWYDNTPYLIGVEGKRKLSAAAKDELKKQLSDAGQPIIDVGNVGAALLNEFPTFDEVGTLGGSSFNELKAAAGTVDDIAAIQARLTTLESETAATKATCDQILALLQAPPA